MAQRVRHLVHEARQALLKRAREYDEKDWESAGRFERHAINAALDLEAAEAENAALAQQVEELRTISATQQNLKELYLRQVQTAERKLAEMREAANALIDYCEAHDWGTMPEPFDSINPLLKLLGRSRACAG